MGNIVIQFKKSRPAIKYFLKPLLFLWLSAAAIDLIWGILAEDLGPDPHETLLHTTGFWALNSLMVTLSVTPVASWLSWPLLMTVRRMTGLFVFFYSSAHLWIFVQFVTDFNVSLIIKEIIERPYITVGFIAWLLLIPLALTSTKAMIRKLGKNWKKLHKLVYLIAILAVWHFTWQVKLDLNEPFLYILLLIVMLGWRDFEKKRRNKKHSRKIV